MKIALSIAEMSVGGIATFVLNLSQSLCHAGHEVIVIAQRPGAWWPRLAEIGVHGYCLPCRRWDSVQQQARRFATYMKAQQVDRLVVNIGIDNRLPMLALHLLPDRLPVALLLHNDRPEIYDLAAVNEAAWNCAVGVSPKVQQTAQARFPQKAIHLILHGITMPTVEQLSTRAAWATPLRLLFVGRLDDHQKGIFRLPVILNACRQRQLPVRLTIMGDGSDQTRLRQLFERAGVADLVELQGFQPHVQVLAAMRSHHCLLLPSNYEGLPIVLLEAQANGCVPLAARLPGITDLTVQNGSNGILVRPDDLLGYVDGLTTLSTAQQWHAMSYAGITLMEQEFALQTMGSRYLTLFAELGQDGYRLPTARSTLHQQGQLPLTKSDYLPRPLKSYLLKLHSTLIKWIGSMQDAGNLNRHVNNGGSHDSL